MALAAQYGFMETDDRDDAAEGDWWLPSEPELGRSGGVGGKAFSEPTVAGP
jgi:hypothetical protein